MTEVIKKYVPYLYFVLGLLWLINGFQRFAQDRDIYKIVFGLTTENKYYFITFKVIVGLIILYAGYERLQSQRKS